MNHLSSKLIMLKILRSPCLLFLLFFLIKSHLQKQNPNISITPKDDPHSNAYTCKALTIGPTLPAAWTTSPSVVVILELPDLAVSGSETGMKTVMIKRSNEQIVLKKNKNCKYHLPPAA